jgi:hypothetical protein
MDNGRIKSPNSSFHRGRAEKWKAGDRFYVSLLTWYLDPRGCPYPAPDSW